MNLKKIIAIIISMCLISGSILFVNAETSLVVKLDSVEVTGGEEFEVNLSLENNPGIAGITLAFEFDNTVVKPISFENKSSFTALTTIDSKDVDLDGLNAINVTYDSMNNIDTDGVIGTFRFKAVDNIDTTITSVIWSIDYPQASVWNEDLEDVVYTTVDGEVTVNGNKSADSSSTTISTTTESTETTTINTTTESTETTTSTSTSTSTITTLETTNIIDLNETSTETTTIAVRKFSGSGGAGASSIKVSGYTSSTTTTEAATEVTTSKVNSEQTTETTTKEEIVSISESVKVTIGSKTVVIGDESYDIDAAPYIQAESNSTLVPLRFVALAIAGGDIENADSSKNIIWDNITKTATITFGGKSIKFTAGNDTIIVDNKPIVMDNGVKAEITDGRMFVPFRALGNALGVDVEWDDNTKTAIYSIK